MQATSSRGSQGRGRGGPRGITRGRGRGGVPKPRSLFRSLGNTAIHTFDVPSDEAVSQNEAVTIKDLEAIGSYNWLAKSVGGVPRILVPGSPRYWVDKNVPYSVQPDQGLSWVDQNGYMMPNSVLLPAVVAVNKLREVQGQKPFVWSDIDVLTDRNNLRKLFRWAKGEKNDFRIDVQLAGNKTLLMSRFSERFQERGAETHYGFNFEKESTILAPGCQDSDGHRRIITYDFNGLKLVVRFEADACIAPARDDSIEDLSRILNSTSITETTFKSSGDPLIVRLGGGVIPEQDIIELKTRANSGGRVHVKWNETYGQLFFSQTPHFFLAEHQNGSFHRITKYSMSSPEIRRAEGQVHTTLQKVRKALDLIRQFVVAQGPDARLALVCKHRVMQVYQRTDTGSSLLPQALLDLF